MGILGIPHQAHRPHPFWSIHRYWPNLHADYLAMYTAIIARVRDLSLFDSLSRQKVH